MRVVGDMFFLYAKIMDHHIALGTFGDALNFFFHLGIISSSMKRGCDGHGIGNYLHILHEISEAI